MSDQATAPATTAAAPNPAPAASAPAPAPAGDAGDAGGTALTSAAPAAAGAAAPAGGEATAAGTAPADGEGDKGKEGDGDPPKPAPRAPAEYADFTRPDGYLLDEATTTEFKAVAKELDLTQEQAQKLIDLDVKRSQAQLDAMNAQTQKWLNELPSDKEFGGEKLSENLAIANKAVAAFGTPELKQLLNESRLGNHPEMIRVFYRAGLAISQDNRFVAGGSGNKPVKVEAANALYPNQN